ncbi:hypothetical protein DL98DRAFT_659591 [Cadophora sp. DSE1049]|nr:hypothetical protein DL98DRAFT_659591 [Cadophora sp. DSE1049]
MQCNIETMQGGTRHMPLRPSISLELHGKFYCFPRLPSEIRAMIWNHAMIRWSETQVICVKMEPSKPGVPTLTSRTAVQCPLLQVNQEARTQNSINFILDTILFDDDQSFVQFCLSADRHSWKQDAVPHIALSYAMWKKFYNPILDDDDVDKVEDEDMYDVGNFLNYMWGIWLLGVRDVTILVTGEDICHRSAVKFETPKASPLESGVTKDDLWEDWGSLEENIADNIGFRRDIGIEYLAEYREAGVSESELQDPMSRYFVDWVCGEGWDIPSIKFMVAKVRDANI